MGRGGFGGVVRVGEGEVLRGFGSEERSLSVG